MFMGIGVVVLVVVAAVAAWSAQRRRDAGIGALAVLDHRLASGELSPEEHAERRQVLREQDERGRWAWSSWSAGLLVAVVLALLALLVVASMGGMAAWGPRAGGWMGDHMGWSGTTGSNTTGVTGAPTRTVEAGDLWFRPDTIEVVADEPVNLHLLNTGSAFHDLTVPAADLVLSAEPGEEASGALLLPDPGRYEFSCSVPGHAEGGMRGTVLVTEAA